MKNNPKLKIEWISEVFHCKIEIYFSGIPNNKTAVKKK